MAAFHSSNSSTICACPQQYSNIGRNCHRGSHRRDNISDVRRTTCQKLMCQADARVCTLHVSYLIPATHTAHTPPRNMQPPAVRAAAVDCTPYLYNIANLVVRCRCLTLKNYRATKKPRPDESNKESLCQDARALSKCVWFVRQTDAQGGFHSLGETRALASAGSHMEVIRFTL